MTTSRLVILTGASRGMGRAMAGHLLQPGNKLLCISRRSDPSLAEQASSRGTGLEQWEQDLSDPVAAAQRVAAWLATQDGQAFDEATLINNAGTIGDPRPLATADVAVLAQAMRVGLEAPLLLTSAFLRGTKDWRGTRTVLNISSGLGRNAMASQASYCAAKAGMDHFTRAVALEEATAPNGARIVSLAPGVIDTDMQVQMRATDPALFADRGRFIDMQEKGLLDSPDTAATKVLAYLERADFGSKPVADVRDAA